jgi:hypothetical protein
VTAILQGTLDRPSSVVEPVTTFDDDRAAPVRRLAKWVGAALAPGTPTERRLVGASAHLLGMPEDRIGRGNHFFGPGGTAVSAVKLAITLNREVSRKTSQSIRSSQTWPRRGTESAPPNR